MCLMLQNSSHVRYFAIGVIGLSSISIQAHKSLTLQQLTDIFESQNVRQIGNCATTFDRPQNHSKALVSLNLFSVFTFFLGLSKKSYLRQL